MAKDWAPLQDEIRDLYHVKSKPLKEVMRLIRGRHDFIASERAYRTQLQRWGYMKYNTQNAPNQRPRPVPRTGLRHQPRRPDPPGVDTFAPSMTAFRSNGEDLPFDAFTGEGNLASSTSGYVDYSHNLDPGTPFAFPASNKTALHHAVVNENLDQVRSLLHAGAAVDSKDLAGNVPLHYSVIAGNLELVKLLLRFGADPNIKGPLGRTTLHQACSMSAPAIAEALLKNGSMLSQRDENGDTPLHVALRQPLLASSVQSLLSKFIQAGADVNLANNQGMTPFHILLDQPFTQQFYGPDQYSHVRATILEFLNQGADISVAFPDGRTAVEVFLKRSGDHWAPQRRRYGRVVSSIEGDIMTELLNKSNTSDHTASSGEPLPHHFLRKVDLFYLADAQWTERLLELANPRTTAKNGNSLLHELMLKPSSATGARVADLVRRGWDPEHRNYRGQTPLHSLFQVAETEQNSAHIESLLLTMAKLKIDIWASDNEGTSVLYAAAARFVKQKPNVLRALFRSDMSNETNDTVSWTGWKRARMAETFNEARQHIDNDPTILPEDIDIQLRKEASGVLAERYLSNAPENFPVDADSTHRRAYMAGILIECRSHDITVDMRFYDALLELCG